MESKDSAPIIGGCRWVDAPVDHDGNGIETWSIADNLGFESPRVFWLTKLAQDQWRGRHAHRDSILATFAINGSCRLTLDDAKQRQVVDLKENGPGLIIGPWIWHDLFDFSANAVVLVIASTKYSEADYIRDYEVFLKQAKARP
jgi:hypothetical protein